MGSNPTLAADDVKSFELTNLAIVLEQSFIPSASVVVCLVAQMDGFDSCFVVPAPNSKMMEGKMHVFMRDERGCMHARHTPTHTCTHVKHVKHLN